MLVPVLGVVVANKTDLCQGAPTAAPVLRSLYTTRNLYTNSDTERGIGSDMMSGSDSGSGSGSVSNSRSYRRMESYGRGYGRRGDSSSGRRIESNDINEISQSNIQYHLSSTTTTTDISSPDTGSTSMSNTLLQGLNYLTSTSTSRMVSGGPNAFHTNEEFLPPSEISFSIRMPLSGKYRPIFHIPILPILYFFIVRAPIIILILTIILSCVIIFLICFPS